jgi:hypothetical protein
MRNKIVRQSELYDISRLPLNEENIKAATAETLQRVALEIPKWDDFELSLPATVKIELIQELWDWMVVATLAATSNELENG